MTNTSIKKANQLQREGKFDEALVEYNKLVKSNPSFSWGYVGLGEIMIAKGQLDKGIVLLRKALNINPNSAYCYYKISEALIEKNNLQEAIVELGNASKIKHKPALAQRIYRLLVLKLEQQNTKNQNNLCEIAIKSLAEENYSNAFNNCAEIVALNSRLADVFHILAEVSNFNSQNEKGEAFSKVIPYIRHLVARPIIQKVWGHVVDNIHIGLNKAQSLQEDNKINKIVLYTCVWQRPELTKIVLSYYSEIKAKLSGKIDLHLLAVGSEGEKSRQLCESCGFDYLEYPNSPLSLKWEYGLNQCANYDLDAVIIVGSDDLISQNLIEFYDCKLREGLVCMGLKTAYFFDTVSKQLFLWKGYDRLKNVKRFGETVGLGRCLSRILLDKLNFNVWKNIKIDSALDRVMSTKLLGLGLQPLDYENLILVQADDRYFKLGHCGFDLNDINVFAFDIKTEVNITPFLGLLKVSGSHLLDPKSSIALMEKHLPPATFEKIKAL